MKRRTLVVIIGLIILAIGGILAVVLSGGSAAATCKSDTTPVHYTVTIQDGKASNTSLQVAKCDTLTITNEDSTTREIAFGPHDDHVAYDGIAERVLNRGNSFTVTMVKTGSFRWHDHLHDEVEGTFTVAE
jgi:plastocyanin